MGYILPVRSYQYTDYQRRMRIGSQDPMYIEKSFPAMFTSQHYDIAKEYTAPRRHFIDVDEKENKYAKVSPDKMYAQLTGKGNNVNNVV